MSHRVNIQYSIELDDLADETLRLLQRSYAKLETAVSQIELPAQERVLSLNTLRSIDDTRQELARIDQAFSDISNIINGYVRFTTADADTQGGEPIDASDLERKLEQFKHSVAHVDEDPA